MISSLRRVIFCGTLFWNTVPVEVSRIDDIRLAVFNDCSLTAIASSANEYNHSQVIATSVTFAMDQLKDIDDVRQVFTVTGSLAVRLIIPCVAERARFYNATAMPLPKQWILYGKTDVAWKIPVTHKNSYTDFALINSIAYNVAAQPFTGLVGWYFSGRFDSDCYLELLKFPFDSQTCLMIFWIFQETSTLSLPNSSVSFGIVDPNRYQKKSSGWQLVDTFENVTKQYIFVGTEMYAVTFGFQLKRRPEYYINNLLLPITAITIAQMATFIIPFGCEERISFTTTVLLSWAVAQAGVASNIPKTPETILLATVIRINSFTSLVAVFYAVITCAFKDSYPNAAHCKIRLYFGPKCNLGVRLGRVIDAVVFFLFTAGLFASNIAIGACMMGYYDCSHIA